MLLIAAHDRPFVGQIAVTPKPLLQIVSDADKALSGRSRLSAPPDAVSVCAVAGECEHRGRNVEAKSLGSRERR